MLKFIRGFVYSLFIAYTQCVEVINAPMAGCIQTKAKIDRYIRKYIKTCALTYL